MAHTSDLRSEGRVKTKDQKQARALREKRKAAGLCSICGVQEIGGSRTSVCYDCSGIQSWRTAISGFRRVVKDLGRPDLLKLVPYHNRKK